MRLAGARSDGSPNDANHARRPPRPLRSTVTLVTIAAAIGTASLLATGCGTAKTSAPPPAALRSELAQRGIEVCGSASADSRFHGAGEAHWYALSKDCRSVHQAVVLGVIPFASEADRDAAFQQSLYRTRFVNNGIAVLRFEHSLVILTRIHNREVAKRAIAKLESLGAR
jgi:hypothetical protein